MKYYTAISAVSGEGTQQDIAKAECGRSWCNNSILIFFLCTDIFVFYCSQLKKDVKMTNIEELQIQSETYYQEVLSIGRYCCLYFRVEYLIFIDIDLLIFIYYLSS